MPATGNVPKGTKQFMRQGHTTVDAFGANVDHTPKGKVNDSPRELKA